MSHIMCWGSGVGCQVSGVKCQVSGVRCQVSGVRCDNIYIYFFDKMSELVGEGLLSTGPTPFSFR